MEAVQTRRFFGESFAPLIDLIYPPRCPAGGEAIASQHGLCAACWDDLVIPADPACQLCQRPFGNAGLMPGAICAPCMASPPVHDGIAAGTLYNDTSRKLILAFKHGRRIALAPMLARLIAARLPEPELEAGRLIVPVPLHRWRLWRRGYNQAALLGRELARMGHGELLVDGLRRTKATPSLGGMGAKARSRTLTGAIGVSPGRGERITGRHIILVDDVLTSGATSGACVRVLKKHGAAQVTVACFARVLESTV